MNMQPLSFNPAICTEVAPQCDVQEENAFTMYYLEVCNTVIGHCTTGNHTSAPVSLKCLEETSYSIRTSSTRAVEMPTLHGFVCTIQLLSYRTSSHGTKKVTSLIKCTCKNLLLTVCHSYVSCCMPVRLKHQESSLTSIAPQSTASLWLYTIFQQKHSLCGCTILMQLQLLAILCFQLVSSKQQWH